MSSSHKKERDRLKRKRKQQELRKRKNNSQYSILGSDRGEMICHATNDWRERGMVSITVLKRLPNGGQAMGAFLVDLWCLGLKDCWGRLNISTEEYERGMRNCREPGMAYEPMDLETARRLVAGGIRFAQMNGFRLPAKYERWVRMLGIDPSPAGDVDVSEFGIDGKLRYVGPLDDLARRLIRQPLEEFLKREDVEFISPPSGFAGLGEYEDEYGEEEDVEDEEEVEEGLEQEMMARLDETRNKLADAVKRWCFANNQVPSPAIPEAVEVILTSLLQIRQPLPEGDEAPSSEVMDETARNIENAMELHEPKEKVELQQGMSQVQAFMSAFKSPEDMFKAVGLETPEDE